MNPVEVYPPSFGSDLAKRIEREAFPGILPCVVPIFGTKAQERIPILNGSGVLLQIADKHFLVSAAHVLDYATIHKVPYFVGSWQQGQLPVSLGGMGVITSAYPTTRAKDDRDLRDDDPFDIGVAVLPPEIVRKLTGRRFLNLAEIDSSRKTLDASYLFFGYPLALSEINHEIQKVNVQALPYFTNLFCEEPENRHINANILLCYGPDSEDVYGNSIEAPHPKGVLVQPELEIRKVRVSG